MNFENEPQPHAPKRRDISLFEGIRTFAASVGTAALLMLSVCGLIGLPLPENAAAHAVSASHITAKTETVRTVQLGGDVFGIKLFSDGVIVAALSEIYADGGLKCPASEAGIQPGDYILSVNGNNVETNAALSAVLSENETNTLTLRRGTETFTAQVTSVLCEGSYKAGMWVRDSAAGIGTVTFYGEDGTSFAALGHGICDSDTEKLIPLESGEFLGADIVGIKKSQKEVTGELQGVFSGGQIADFAKNCITGVYGVNCCGFASERVMPVAMKQEITVGKATLITTLDSDGAKEYECEIVKIYHNDDSKIKNMVVKVTDKELLQKTGGIVQGMSGSPIIQNGKFIGAVTHVFVDDSTSGYAIFAENMLEEAESVSADQLDAAS